MKKITFGILAGKRNVDDIIESIIIQEIPDYEIIVVGNVETIYTNIQVIHQPELDEKLWITKKKNIVIQSAKGDIIIIIKDYVTFEVNWYNGFVKFCEENEWDICMNKLVNNKNERCLDWVWESDNKSTKKYGKGRNIDYNIENHPKMYIPGSIVIAKCYVFKEYEFDENLVGVLRGSDIIWSRRALRKFNYKFNQHSSCILNGDYGYRFPKHRCRCNCKFCKNNIMNRNKTLDKIDVVIARYNENLAWINKLDSQRFNVIIYNKGDDLNAEEITCKISVYKLENVGREAHTILHHIVHNFNTLAKHTIFLQGYPFDHFPNMIKYLNNYDFDEFSLDFLGNLSGKSLNHFYEKHKSKFTAPEFEQLVKITELSNCKWTKEKFKIGAMFLTHQRYIYKHTKSYYNSLLQITLDGYKAPWVLEKFWHQIFSKSDADHFISYLQNNIKSYKVPDDCVIDLQGWMDNNIMKVFDYIDKTVKNPFLIEVGSWKGLSATNFATYLKEINGNILCIDTWLGAPEFWTKKGINDCNRGKSLKHHFGYPSVYYTFLNNVYLSNLENTIIPFPISSDAGSNVLKTYGIRADAIYIDGSHEQGMVLNDIDQYWGLVKPGGIIFGDDYTPGWPGVIHDVSHFCEKNKLKAIIHGRVWFIIKPFVC